MENSQSRYVVEKHVLILPADTNMEQSCIRRKEYQRCFGIVLELIFQRKIFKADHLKWEILEERAKTGYGFDEVLQAELENQSNEESSETDTQESSE
jgi:hypothetical protein